MLTKKNIKKELKEIIDPEIGVSIVDMGLIKKIMIEKNNVRIRMTVTSPYCPMVRYFVEQVKEKLKSIGAEQVEVEIV